MKQHYLLPKNTLILLVLAFTAIVTSCKKLNDGSPEPSKSTGHIVVSCSDCQLQYGMPDQYKQVNISGTSQRYSFTYAAGYTLVAYITPLSTDQNASITVYNASDSVIYKGSVSQINSSYWETRTVLPSDK